MCPFLLRKDALKAAEKRRKLSTLMNAVPQKLGSRTGSGGGAAASLTWKEMTPKQAAARAAVLRDEGERIFCLLLIGV